MINDISGLRFDKSMARVAADLKVPVIVMHIQGKPRTMQDRPAYHDLIGEILEYFAESIRIAASYGVREDKIILDPGIGFGKTLEHNLEIINRLKEFRSLISELGNGGVPSRRVIYKVSDFVDSYDGDSDFTVPAELDCYFHGYRIPHKIGRVAYTPPLLNREKDLKEFRNLVHRLGVEGKRNEKGKGKVTQGNEEAGTSTRTTQAQVRKEGRDRHRCVATREAREYACA
jgi:hypothetical protein